MNAKAELQDVNQLPYEDASFDAIVAIQVIEYLEQPAKALSELQRVSSANGQLIVGRNNREPLATFSSLYRS